MRTARLSVPRIPRLDGLELELFVRSFLDRREAFLSAVCSQGSPLYVVESEALVSGTRLFREAFSAVLPDIRIYYALKSNSHPIVATKLVEQGLGLDVSSGLELKAALGYGAMDIIFSGPGKLPDELKLAVDNADRVTVLLDSMRELEKLEKTACQAQTPIRAGVRLATDGSGIWRKFGIPLDRLSDFFDHAQKCRQVDLCGLQFHVSWNLDAKAQVLFIGRLGRELKLLPKKHLKKIRFIDIGGGFWPEQGEWLQPGVTPRGMLQAVLSDIPAAGCEHYKRSACSISDFADDISFALRKYLPEDVKCTICVEPGRWLCNDAMHILLTVTDRKSSDVVITDGGTNAVGWERFESDYFPIINLTRPGLREQECLVAGSLCTPHDLWGYSYFGESINEGDILLVPNQGAYTYSLRQEFIKPVPKCVSLNDTGADFDTTESDFSIDNERQVSSGDRSVSNSGGG